MATFLTLINFTEKGVAAIRETASRADAFIAAARESGVKVKELYWCVGAHDGAIILEAPSEEAAASVLIGLSARGFVRTQTMRAFTRQEIGSVIPK
jgi:uncharacterized protein with GYD domain